MEANAAHIHLCSCRCPIGLLIGPRGSNQKRMEDESGAKILIRGKGSSKDPTGDPDENEELHVLITAESDEAIAKAQSAVEDILFNPQQAMKLKQEQLRKCVCLLALCSRLCSVCDCL